MKFQDLLERVGDVPVFDLATVVQLFDEPRDQIRTQLSRWRRAGRILALRRGLYVFSPPYQRRAPPVLLAANLICRPSYLSELWCLGFFGLIPEMVVTYTSVTTRATRVFENSLGRFRFRSLKPALFFGFETRQLEGNAVRIALPEKALMDFWYLESGEWTPDRLPDIERAQVLQP